MRSTILTATTLALVGLAAPSATAAGEPETTRERGYVLECQGTSGGHSAYVSLYENDVYGNYLQVILDEDPKQSAGLEKDDIIVKGDVRTGARIKGKQVRIVGNLGRLAERTPVHEEHDDAGQHIVVDGTHRALVYDLGLLYKGRSYQLVCDSAAFFYDLQVTKTDITGDES